MYFNDNFTLTLTAVEMATIREALRYAAEQVHDSDIPVFETYETLNRNTGEIDFDERMHEANMDKAILAMELADTLDLIEADSCDWTCLNNECGGHFNNGIEVWCRHHKTEDFGTPLVREFIWRTPHNGTIYTSVLEDCVMPINTTVAVHYVPYKELTDKNVVHYYTLDDLRNRVPKITENEELDSSIIEALRTFISYHR